MKILKSTGFFHFTERTDNHVFYGVYADLSLRSHDANDSEFPSERTWNVCYRPQRKKEETECDLCCFYRRKKCDLPTCPFIREKIKFGTATKKQIMDAVFMNIRNSKFRKRLSSFIQESENINMKYFGKKHESDFKKTLERIDSENYKLISAVYLLTADTQLWRKVQNQAEKNCIHFDKINLGAYSRPARSAGTQFPVMPGHNPRSAKRHSSILS